MRVLITICGRAGSRSVRHKNMRPFCGHPLAVYTLAAARLFAQQTAGNIIEIVVSSDSDELLRLAGQVPGVRPLVRPAELAEAQSAKIPAIRHAVDACERANGCAYDAVIDLDITSPFRAVSDIQGCLAALHAGGQDVVFSVVPARRNPYFNMVEVVSGQVRRAKPSTFVTRQEAPPVFDMNASIYAYRREALRNRILRSPFEGTCGIHQMPDTYVLDIDDEADFEAMSRMAGWLLERHAGIREVFDYAATLDPQGHYTRHTFG